MRGDLGAVLASVAAGRQAPEANLLIISGIPCMVKPGWLPMQDEPGGAVGKMLVAGN
jgi:hypothetical protein